MNYERKAGVQTPCSTFPGTPCSSAQPPCTPPAGGRAGSCRSRVVPLPQAPKAVLSTQPRKRATEGRWGVHAPLVQVALACLPSPLAPASQEAKLGAMVEGWCLPTAPQLHGPTHSKALKYEIRKILTGPGHDLGHSIDLICISIDGISLAFVPNLAHSRLQRS